MLNLRRPVLLAVALVLLSAAPATAAGHRARPVARKPTVRVLRRTETPVANPDSGLVAESYVRLYDPLPKSVGAPAACNWIGYLRWRDRHGPRDPSRAHAILVVMPGLSGGASLFEDFADNVIRTAAARHQYFEVWALDRRSNCLEDQTGMRAVVRSGNYHTALDYYYGHRTIDGHRFAGFFTSRQVPFLYSFGLAQTMRDEYDVITRGIPNPAVRARKVLCGGHSLGGSLTGAFASWQFGPDDVNAHTNTANAGYAQCAGFFALDTAVSNNLGGGSKDVGLKGDALYDAESAGIRSGAIPDLANSLPVLNPETLQVSEIMGLAAEQDPSGTELLSELPHDPNINTALSEVLSQNDLAFTTGIPNPRSYRLTNQALLGTLFDDNSQPIAALQASLGTFGSGAVEQKDFPFPGFVPDVPLLGPTLSGLLADTIVTPGGTNSRLMIPGKPAGPLYSWRDYDQVGAPGAPRQVDDLGHPFTSPSSEVTDVTQFAHSLYDDATDAWELYFPMRLLLDDAAFLTGARNGDLSAVRYENGPDLRPYLELIAGEGVATDAESSPIEAGVEPRRRVVLPGYNHLDMGTAAYHQNNGKPEPISSALVGFADQVTADPRRR